MPLDEFYYKKTEQFDSFANGHYMYLNRCDLIITNWDNWNVTLDGKVDELDNKSESNYNKGRELQLEAQKIQRDFYREYGLDDLISKWQD